MDNNNAVLTVIQETEILGKKIQMYGSIESPWFMATDVAIWIEHSNARSMIKTVDQDEKGVKNVYTLGGIQSKWFLTEDGLYEVCMQSRKPIAKQMKKEIKSYLRQIRLTGGAIETNREAEFIDKYFPSFTEETKLSMVHDLQKQNEEYKKQITNLEPKAQAYTDLMTAQGYLQFIDVAALVEIGRNTLFQFLRKCKVLTKQSNYNVPYGRFSKNGMFKVITSRSPNGYISSVTMVSPKGLNYIYKLMKKKNVLDEFNTTALLQKINELEVAQWVDQITYLQMLLGTA